jgi:AraC-like DNA-binding protein
MGDFDVLLRGATIGICLAIGVLFWRTLPAGRNRRSSICFLGGVVGYLLIGFPGFTGWLPLLQLAVAMVAISAPFFFWVQLSIVFDDSFAPRWTYGLWLVALEVTGIARYSLRAHLPAILAPSVGYLFRLMSILLVGHALWIVWRGRDADLVEARAKSRLGLIFLMGFVIVAIIVAALLLGPVTEWPEPAKLAESAGMLILALAFGPTLLQLHPDFQPILADQPPAPPPLGEAPAAHDPDATLLARLDRLMGDEKAWSETGLTIGSLAEQVGVPEYRLRRLINQRLGFRNFTAFVNEYRLAAAAARLVDPAFERMPVLTIALDLGWASIGPFNRAFRDRFGMPPSDYRRRGLLADS